jgi:hypothetical protein
VLQLAVLFGILLPLEQQVTDYIKTTK